MSFAERIAFLDRVRGIAALTVLVQHVVEQVCPGYGVWSNTHLNLGMAGVVAFFLVSGHVITHTGRNRPLLAFIVNRFFRIFPLYWAVLALSLGLLAFRHEWPTLKTTLIHLTLLQDYVLGMSEVGGTWTLPIEFGFYCLFAIGWRLHWLQRAWLVPVASALLIGGLVAAGELTGHRVPSAAHCCCWSPC